MKKSLYLISSILVFLISCAEEGPFSMGKLDCDLVEVTDVTPTTALVTVSYDKNSLITKLGSLILVDKPLEYSDLNNEKYYEAGNFYFEYSELPDNQKRFFFTNLKPNTTYYVIANTSINYDNDEEAEWENYYTGLSFKTVPDGDFSCFGKATYDVISETKEMLSIKVYLPQGLKFYDYNKLDLYASTTEDMSNSVKFSCDHFEFLSNIFTIKGLEQKRYYLQLKGTVVSTNIFDYWEYSNGYRWDNICIGFQKTLDLSK